VREGLQAPEGRDDAPVEEGRGNQGRGEQIQALPKENGRMKLGCLGGIGLGDRPSRRYRLIDLIDTTEGAAADGCPSVVHYPSFLFLVLIPVPGRSF